ncbi:MAG: nickel-dependent hydrogenase large subunit [Acetobacteraceae bacterium]
MAGRPEPPLLALWADTREVHALLRDEEVPLLVSTAVEAGGYPALSPVRPSAARFERMVHDLWGHQAAGGIDARPWLDHGRWALSAPMAQRPGAAAKAGTPEFQFDDDVDQVPLGPVLGGIQPASHLRLGVRGDRVVRLEARLGYTHRGCLTLIRGKSPRAAARFAARLAGEATVAHALAFARAAEDALNCDVPPRALAWRDVMLEVERAATLLDVAASVAEAAGLDGVATRFAWHGEAVRRAADAAFGHRLMMDCVVPGGIAADAASGGGAAIDRALVALAAELPALAMPGLAGHAQAAAARRLPAIEGAVHLARGLLATLPEGPVSAALPVASGEGLGFASAPGGPVWHWLRLDHGQIASVFMCDPAWAGFQALEVAMAGAPAEDLALVRASFGLSSAGADL